MRLDQNARLVLILQIDKFQISTYWTVVLLRVIAGMVATGNTFIVPVCTGTAPSRISDLGDNSSSTISLSSQYKTTNLHLSLMNFSNPKKIQWVYHSL